MMRPQSCTGVSKGVSGGFKGVSFLLQLCVCIKYLQLGEPACGDGNFLAEILRRKLDAVKARYQRSAPDAEKYAVMALTSIYGVDILEDNVAECRERLFGIWDERYTALCGRECREECRAAARYILSRNVLCGNALSLRKVDGAGQDTQEPIIFSEWVFTGQSSVRRSDFRLDVLMNENPDEDQYQGQLSLFAEETSFQDNWMIDPDTGRTVPRPVREYAPVYYWKVQEQGGG